MKDLAGHVPQDATAERILLERSDFKVRLADDHGRRSKSSMLIQRRYSWRGYKHDTANNLASTANQITLQACQSTGVFGTLSLSFDSEGGLAVDELYKQEVDEYRKAGARVCELTRLAIDPEYGSKEVLGALFHLAYIFGSVFGPVTDVFIEVNPRHVLFYKRMLNFKQAGESKMCERVSAPAVLLHLEVAYVAEQIARYGGSHDTSQRSLYPFFFSKQEQEGLERRVRALSTASEKRAAS